MQEHGSSQEQEAASQHLKELKAELAELKASIPVHSMKPAMMQRIEDLEEEVKALEQDAGPSR